MYMIFILNANDENNILAINKDRFSDLRDKLISFPDLL